MSPKSRNRILLELGRGGMGTVYLAVAHGVAGFHKLKVVKRLNPELARDPEFARMFLDEARLAARLNHPNVVQTNEVGVDDRHHFLEMEYLEGQSLHAVQRRAETRDGLPLRLGLEILRQALAGLHYTHEVKGRGGAPLGIVHRDVSPHNLFVTYAGSVKVLDFGIAKTADAVSRTLDGVVRGKLTYMAPEQALRGPVDRRTDIYAIGTILWQMLTRRPIWEGLSVGQILARLERGTLERPAAIESDVPPELESICLRCLERDPAARYATAEEAQNAIERAADALGLRATPRDLGAWVASLFDDARRMVAAQIETRLQEIERAEPVEELDEVDPPILSRPLDEESLPRESLPPATRRSTEQTVVDSPSAARGRRGRWRWLVSSLVAALLLVTSVVAVAILRGKLRRSAGVASTAPVAPSSSSPAASATGGPTTVLILGIQNETPDPALDGTADTVLAFALRRSTYVDPYSGATLRELAGEVDPEPRGVDEDMARRLATQTSERVVTVRGRVAPAGAAFALTLKATEATTQATVFESTTTADGDHLVSSLGVLACALRRALGDASAPTDPDQAGETGMSTSVVADHEYVVGTSLNRLGRYEDALAHLERALALDPDFAHARASYGIILWNDARRAEAVDALRQAFKWVDRMCERDRLAFLGDYYSTLGDYDRGIDAYRAVLEKWPRDPPALIDLALTYQQKGDQKHAVEAGRRAAEAHPRIVLARSNLTSIYLSAGALEDTLHEGEKVLADFAPPPTDTLRNMAAAAVLLGRYDEVARHLGQLQPIQPGYVAVASADLAIYQGRLRDALDILVKEKASVEAVHDDVSAQQLAAYIARALLRTGDKAAATRYADLALHADDARLALLGGLAMIDAGHAERVTALEARLASSFLPEDRATGGVLTAAALRAKGDAHGAVLAYQDAVHTFDSWWGRFGLGLAYLDLKAFAEAYTELQTCWSRRGEAATFWLPSAHLVPPVLYYLARAEQGMGNPEAQATYKAFLALEPAPQGDAMADDARRRLMGR